MGHDPYKYFRVEARELLDELGKGVLDLERGGSAGSDLVPRLLRLAHTLKGAARVVKQLEVAELAHAIEDTLARLRDRPGPPPPEAVNGMLKFLDAMEEHVAALVPAPPPAPEGDGRPAPAPLDEAFRTVRADIADMDALLMGVAEAEVQAGAAGRAVAGLEKAGHLANLLAQQLGSPRAREAPSNGAAAKMAAFAEELRAVLGGLERNLAGSLEQFGRELRKVRDAAERLRLLPAGVLETALERAARDSAAALGKRVSFESRGGEVRLDAHVLGGVQNALVQLVRNAVAHGIESEDERSKAGKPLPGRVVVEVARRGNRVVFECRDDGQGVDLEAVKRAARDKGLPVEETERLGPDGLLQLLLKGGLTTSTALTELSGRGVGLDVVREAAARLGGDVSVRTEAGRGTAIALVVPVSLSSLDALLVEAAGLVAAIPLDAVRATLSLDAREIVHTAEGESILRERKAIRLGSLPRILGGQRPEARAYRRCRAVVIEGGGRLVAIGVDRLLGTGNVMLRPLPAFVPPTPVVAGASLDGEGNPQIVLDPEELAASALESEAPGPPSEPAARLPILVIDDSLTTRMLEESILESAGYEVDLACSGEEGIEKARGRRYGLFLVDIEMPGMDGFAFVERTRQDRLLADVPAILVTSRSTAKDRQRGQEVGARAYIVKGDFDQAELLGTIRELMG